MSRSRFGSYWMLFVCSITHGFVHVFTMMHTALIPVFMSEFGLSIFESGLLVSIPLVLSVSVSLPYGFLTDRIDLRKLIVASLLISGFSGLAVSQAGDFHTLLLPLLFIPLSSTLYHPPALALVSELFPRSQRNRALGVHGAGGTSGVAVGPITLGLVLGAFGWRFAYQIWVLPVLLSTLFLLRLPKVPAMTNTPDQSADSETPDGDRKLKSARYGYLILLVAMSVSGVGVGSLSVYMTTYLVSNRQLAESTASLVYGLSSFIGILGSLSGGYLGDRLGGKRWMTLAYLGRLFVDAGVWLGPLWALVAIYLTGGFFGGSTMGPSTSLAAEFSPKKRRGLAYTIFMLPFSLMGAISPVIAAKIIELYEIQALFPFAISLSLVSILLLQLLPEKSRISPAPTYP